MDEQHDPDGARRAPGVARVLVEHAYRLAPIDLARANELLWLDAWRETGRGERLRAAWRGIFCDVAAVSGVGWLLHWLVSRVNLDFREPEAAVLVAGIALIVGLWLGLRRHGAGLQRTPPVYTYRRHICASLGVHAVGEIALRVRTDSIEYRDAWAAVRFMLPSVMRIHRADWGDVV
ncbi:MAG: hypothetical protein AAFP26_02660, partial [Planctomycetota bacterium]